MIVVPSRGFQENSVPSKLISLNNGQLDSMGGVEELIEDFGVGDALGRISFDDGGSVKNKIFRFYRSIKIGLGNNRNV